MVTNKILTNKGYQLEINKLTQKQLTKIKKDLSVKPKVHPDFDDDVESIQLYEEDLDKGLITVPRYYGFKNFGKQDKTELKPSNAKLEFDGKLRDYQIPIVEKSLETIKTIGGGIISLGCGGGKTTLALYIASILKLKTLVIVHKTFLQNQWYERAKQFLPTSSIGMIRQKKTDVKNRDIVIGMLQSISMIEYDQNIFADFGLVIVDECHHIGSRIFSKALRKAGATYTLGLSATPVRGDGLSKVIYWHLGEVMYSQERKKNTKVVVKGVYYETNDKLFVEKKMYFKGKTRPSQPKTISNICSIQVRDEFIVNILKHLMVQYERKILVLSGRLEHLNKLRTSLNNIIKEEEEKGNLVPNEITTSKYVGGMKAYELEDSAEASVIFATYDMAEEGLDIDKLNTLILASPNKKNDVTQSIGRIMRKPAAECEISPLIIDMIDCVSNFDTKGDKRLTFYTKNEYNVERYHAYNEKFITPKEYLVMKKVIKETDNLPIDELIKTYYVHRYGEPQYHMLKDFDEINQKDFEYTPTFEEVLKVEIEFDEATINKN